MTTTLDRIRAEARELHFWRTVLTVIAAVLFAVGWVVCKVFVVIWAALTFCAAAIKVGWSDARRRP